MRCISLTDEGRGRRCMNDAVDDLPFCGQHKLKYYLRRPETAAVAPAAKMVDFVYDVDRNELHRGQGGSWEQKTALGDRQYYPGEGALIGVWVPSASDPNEGRVVLARVEGSEAEMGPRGVEGYSYRFLDDSGHPVGERRFAPDRDVIFLVSPGGPIDSLGADAPAAHTCVDAPGFDGTMAAPGACAGCDEAAAHPCAYCGYGRGFPSHSPEAHLENGDPTAVTLGIDGWGAAVDVAAPYGTSPTVIAFDPELGRGAITDALARAGAIIGEAGPAVVAIGDFLDVGGRYEPGRTTLAEQQARLGDFLREHAEDAQR